MGNSQSQQNIADILNKAVLNVIMTNVARCSTDVKGSQSVKMRCNAPPEVIKMFLDSENCKKNGGSACFPCVQENLNQIMTLDLNASCTSDIKANISDTAKFANELEQLLKKETGISDLFGGGADQTNIAVITNEIASTVSQTNVTELLTALTNSQLIEMDGTGGSIQKGITQTVVSNVILSVLNKNDTYVTKINEISNKLSQKAIAKPLNIFASVSSACALIMFVGFGFLAYSQRQLRKFIGPVGFILAGLVLVIIGGALLNRIKDDPDASKTPGIVCIVIGSVLFLIGLIWGFWSYRKGRRAGADQIPLLGAETVQLGRQPSQIYGPPY
jgi:hypothetical protein